MTDEQKLGDWQPPQATLSSSAAGIVPIVLERDKPGRVYEENENDRKTEERPKRKPKWILIAAVTIVVLLTAIVVMVVLWKNVSSTSVNVRVKGNNTTSASDSNAGKHNCMVLYVAYMTSVNYVMKLVRDLGYCNTGSISTVMPDV